MTKPDFLCLLPLLIISKCPGYHYAHHHSIPKPESYLWLFALHVCSSISFSLFISRRIFPTGLNPCL